MNVSFEPKNFGKIDINDFDRRRGLESSNKSKKINMIKLLITIVVSLTALTGVLAQNPNESSPSGAQEAMLKFVELNNKQLLQSDEARKLLTGDAAKWNAAWFGQVFGKPDKIVSVEKNYSVARIEAIDKNSRVVDLYFYLKFDNGWKIRSMRAMAQTGFLEATLTTLKSKGELTAEEKESLANTELVLSSDKMLTGWFRQNRAALDKLAALAILETKKKPVKAVTPPRRTKNGVTVAVVTKSMGQGNAQGNSDEDEPRTIEYITKNTKQFPKTAGLLKTLHLSALETKSDGNIEITIGGVTDNSVGFVYSPAGTPPLIDGWRYIWVEEVAARWFLYRTT